MNPYPAYARPLKFVDIPANPGFKVRVVSKYGPPATQWHDVIAWRLSQDDTDPRLGVPIVAKPSGICVVVADSYQLEFLQFVFPGQEIPEDPR